VTDTTATGATVTQASDTGATERVERFKEEIDRLNVVEPVAKRELMLFRLGVALLVIGPIVSAAGFVTDQPRDATNVGLLGVAITVAGAALFVSYSLSRFLRFWLVRLSLEQRAATDRVVDAVGPRTT
jgi:hypothetical protein